MENASKQAFFRAQRHTQTFNHIQFGNSVESVSYMRSTKSTTAQNKMNNQINAIIFYTIFVGCTVTRNIFQ